MDYELTLFDRLEVIKSTNAKHDLEHNAYLSFSGGKDSTVLHYLLDKALPNNRIPRVFIDTGIEYQKVREFVLNLAKDDDRFVILKPTQAIKPMLEKHGYPFKSKEFSKVVNSYQIQKEEIDKYINMPTQELKEFFLVHQDIEKSLMGKGVFVIYFLHGIRPIRDKQSNVIDYDIAVKHKCPQMLRHLFTKDFSLHLSSNCCLKLKKEPAHKWSHQNNRPIVMTGMKQEEGGQRENIKGCVLTDKNGNVTKFHPLLVVDEQWENEFVTKLESERGGHILCELYYPPYNFRRSGCKGCPYAMDIQHQLDVMEQFMPNERKQCEMIWKPVYDEYRRLNYRLKKNEQLSLLEEK